jgi:hypothetical protein
MTPTNLPSFSRNEIVSATKRDTLMVETANQIIKDFGEFGLEITFSGNVGQFYDELYHQMFQRIEQIISESQSRFQALLYRIDVSQKDIDMYHRQTPNANYHDVLTELIIHREIKKVMVRNYFKTQSSNNKNIEEDI